MLETASFAICTILQRDRCFFNRVFPPRFLLRRKTKSLRTQLHWFTKAQKRSQTHFRFLCAKQKFLLRSHSSTYSNLVHSVSPLSPVTPRLDNFNFYFYEWKSISYCVAKDQPAARHLANVINRKRLRLGRKPARAKLSSHCHIAPLNSRILYVDLFSVA